MKNNKTSLAVQDLLEAAMEGPELLEVIYLRKDFLAIAQRSKRMEEALRRIEEATVSFRGESDWGVFHVAHEALSFDPLSHE